MRSAFYALLRRWLSGKTVTPPTPGDGLRTPWHSTAVSSVGEGGRELPPDKFRFSNAHTFEPFRFQNPISHVM